MKWVAFFLCSTAFAAHEDLPFFQALDKIIERSIPVGVQKETLEAKRSSNLSSHLSLLPSISLEASQTKSSILGLETQRRGIAARADLNLLKFGADVSAMKQANAEERAEEHLVNDAVLKAEADGVKAIVAYIQSRLELVAKKKILETRKEALDTATQRFKRGIIPSQEVDKFSIDFANAESEVQDALAKIAFTENELINLLGSATISPAWPLNETLEKGIPLTKEVNLSSRPDWLAAEAKADAADQFASRSWGNTLPSLDLSLSYGYYDNFSPSPGVKGAEWVGGITLTVPLFDKLTNYGNYRAAVHTKQAAILKVEQIKRQAKADYDSAYKALQISLQSALAREKTVEVSRRLYEANLKRYKRALVNANDLQLDQDRLYRSELLAISGWGEVHQELTKTCHSIGQRLADCLKLHPEKKGT